MSMFFFFFGILLNTPRMQMAKDAPPPTSPHHSSGVKQKERENETDRRMGQAYIPNTARDRDAYKCTASQRDGGDEEEGGEKRLVSGSGLSAIPGTYTVFSPQRESQTVQHAAERERREEDEGKM